MDNIHWDQVSDPRDTIHRAVELLVAGNIIGVPLRTGHVAAALATSPTALKALSAMFPPQDSAAAGVLCLLAAEQLVDMFPDRPLAAQRALSRCEPAPQISGLIANGQQPGLVEKLPPDAAAVAAGEHGWTVTRADTDLLVQLQQLLPAPLVLAPAVPVACAELRETISELSLLIEGAVPPEPPTCLRIQSGEWEMVREGVPPFEDVRRLSGELIVFVCTGNTCRSPMAEALFRQQLAESLACRPEELEDRGYLVFSAGLAAADGNAASVHSISAVGELGVDLSDHQSRPLTAELLRHADRVFTMTNGHRDAILEAYPAYVQKVQTLSGDGVDVSDPIGADLDQYRRCRDEIRENLQAIVAEVRGENSSR